jgi:pimeloyl-ACP methyl ester carboxylesterase
VPVVEIDDVTVSFDESGSGEPVLLIPGTGARGRTWSLHQGPALVKAGYRVITIDNRGVGGSGPARPGLTIGDLVADTVAVIESAGVGPCRLVGSSLGAYIVQELLVARPELCRQAVLMASRARPDAFSRAVAAAELKLAGSGLTLPPDYEAVTRARQNLSPATLQDEAAVQDWLDIFELSPTDRVDPGRRAQLAVVLDDDRRPAYRAIRVPTLVLSFAHDVVAPPSRGRELAATIPSARYVEIPDAGHYGFLEQPEAVNTELLRFFAPTDSGRA